MRNCRDSPDAVHPGGTSKTMVNSAEVPIVPNPPVMSLSSTQREDWPALLVSGPPMAWG